MKRNVVHLLDVGDSGDIAVRPDTVDEIEVPNIQRTVRGSSEARRGEQRYLGGVPFTPVPAHHLPLLTCPKQGGHELPLSRKVNVLTVALL